MKAGVSIGPWAVWMTPARALPSRAPISNLSRCGSSRTPAAYGCVALCAVVPLGQLLQPKGELRQLLVFAQQLDHTSLALGFGEAGWKTLVDLLSQSHHQIQSLFRHRRYRGGVLHVRVRRLPIGQILEVGADVAAAMVLQNRDPEQQLHRVVFLEHRPAHLLDGLADRGLFRDIPLDPRYRLAEKVPFVVLEVFGDPLQGILGLPTRFRSHRSRRRSTKCTDSA